MLLKTILDIGPDDPKVVNLFQTGEKFGLTDMFEAVLLVTDLIEKSGTKVGFYITTENAAETIATMIAMAVINYASWKYETFTVDMGTTDEKSTITFYRSYTSEQHKEFAEKSFEQAQNLIKAYFPDEA